MPGVRCCVPWPALSAGGPRCVGCEVSSLYHRQQGVASLQEPGRTADAERVTNMVDFTLGLLRCHSLPGAFTAGAARCFAGERASTSMAARRLRRACSVWDTVSKRCGTSKGPALWRGLHAMEAGTSGNKGRWTRSKQHLPTRSTGRRMDRGTTKTKAKDQRPKTKDTERARRWRGAAEKGSASRPVFLGYWPRRPLQQKGTWVLGQVAALCVCVCECECECV